MRYISLRYTVVGLEVCKKFNQRLIYLIILMYTVLKPYTLSLNRMGHTLNIGTKPNILSYRRTEHNFSLY